MAKDTKPPSSAPVELSQEAYSVAKTPEGKYFLVKFHYDLETGTTEIVEKLEQPSRGEAFERFKITVAQSKMLGD